MEGVLDKLCIVQRQTSTRDSSGGALPAWVNRLTNIACCKYPVDAGTRIEFAQKKMAAQDSICTEVDIAANEKDRIVIDGSYFYVLGYKRFESPFGQTLYQTITGQKSL